MKAISLNQPHASLLVTRQPCDACEGGTGYVAESCDEQMVKRFIDSDRPCPPALIGERIAFHAAKRVPGRLQRFGDYVTNRYDGDWFWRHISHMAAGPLPLGAIVGSGRVTACYPIMGVGRAAVVPDEIPAVVRFDPPHSGGQTLALYGARTPPLFQDISDQLPYGDFTPGRFAWQIEDAASTSERCPWCWGTRRVANPSRDPAWGELRLPCPVCDGVGRCDPIPAKGKQRIWNWEVS